MHMSSEFEVIKLKNENAKLKRKLLYSEADRIYQFYSNNPDVGMPYSYAYCLKEASKYLKLSDQEFDALLKSR